MTHIYRDVDQFEPQINMVLFDTSMLMPVDCIDMKLCTTQILVFSLTQFKTQNGLEHVTPAI